MKSWLDVRALWDSYWKEMTDAEFEALQTSCNKKDILPELAIAALTHLKTETEKGYRPSIKGVTSTAEKMRFRSGGRRKSVDECQWCLGYQHSPVEVFVANTFEAEHISSERKVQRPDGATFVIEPYEGIELGINLMRLNLPCGKCNNPFLRSADDKDIKYWEVTYGKKYCNFVTSMAEEVYDRCLKDKALIMPIKYASTYEADVINEADLSTARV